jgi:hypothetical protein
MTTIGWFTLHRFYNKSPISASPRASDECEWRIPFEPQGVVDSRVKDLGVEDSGTHSAEIAKAVG